MDSRGQVRRLSLPDHYRSNVRIFTRNGHDWMAKYRELPGAAKRLGGENAIIDVK
jgi:ATP-dependent DNA ligase